MYAHIYMNCVSMCIYSYTNDSFPLVLNDSFFAQKLYTHRLCCHYNYDYKTQLLAAASGRSSSEKLLLNIQKAKPKSVFCSRAIILISPAQ